MAKLDITFDEITRGQIVYTDDRTAHYRRARRVEVAKYHEVQNEVYDEYKTETGLEPGCQAMRPDVARQEFELSAEADNGRDYLKWLREREAYRKNLDEGTTDTHILMLTHHKITEEPLGGIGIFSIKLVGTLPDDTMQFTAYCSPLMTSANASASFMLYLLDNPVTGKFAGNSAKFQLVEWKFPINNIRCRWDVTVARSPQWIALFQNAHTLGVESQGGQTFITTLKKNGS